MIKVLLLEQIVGLGKQGEIREVKHSYATNVLFPKNKAKLITPEEESILKKREEKEKSIEKDLLINKSSYLNQLKNKVLSYDLSINKKVGEREIINDIKKNFKIVLSKKNLTFTDKKHFTKSGRYTIGIVIGDENTILNIEIK